MSNGLPAQIDPIRLAEEGTRLQGSLSTRGMQRLPIDAPATIEIDLEFFKSAPGRWEMRGTVTAAVRLVCQRCLAPFPYLVDAESQLRFLRTDAAASEEETEATIVDGPVRLADLVEEEVMLALPMIALHVNSEACAPAQARLADKGKPHPFAVLAQLKKQKRSDN